MNLNDLFLKGIEMHHITNTAYPLTPSSFMKYKLRDGKQIHQLLIKDMEKLDALALYAHVPFCQHRCKFCEYAVVSGADAQFKDEYTDKMLREMDMYAEIAGDKRVLGFDIGGGTPTQLSVKQLERIANHARRRFPFDPRTEMSIETTPVIAANEGEKIAALYEMGFRRISMGIQTIDAALLTSFEREGGVKLYDSAMGQIRRAGFEKFNVDLMYGFLHQSRQDFLATLHYTIAARPEYITLYRNRYKGTKIAEEAQDVTLGMVNRQYEAAYEALTAAGYLASYGKNTFSRIPGDYGTSDYLTGRVMDGLPYLGFGLGAQSFGHQYLAYNEGAAAKALGGYFKKLDAGEFPLQDIYNLPLEEAIAKMVSVAFYFGFLDLGRFEWRFGVDFTAHFRDEINFLQQRGLITFEGGKMVVTKAGVDQIGGVIPMFYSQMSREELLNKTATAFV